MEAISVIIPTYNRAGLLPLALNSVLTATSERDEIIVVDDGSTDETHSVVSNPGAPWNDRIRYLRVTNGGAGYARNIGVAAATHDLIAFADSDDEWLPYRLELQRPVMDMQPWISFCFTDFGQIFPDGHIESNWLVKWSRDTRDWDVILARGFQYSERWPLPRSFPPTCHPPTVHVGSMYHSLLHAIYINVNTVLLRRSVVGEALQFGVNMPTYEDWECWARISRKGLCAYIDVDTALQRTHGGPRLTQAGLLVEAQTRIALIERTWARDVEFMRDRGEEVAGVLARQKEVALRQLIRLNRREEAAQLLACETGHWLERLLLLVPHKAVETGLRLRNLMSGASE